MFVVGQKVVRINFTHRSMDSTREPGRGEICTVSWVGFIEEYDAEVIDLIECPRPETDEVRRGWNASYFRPVIERKTDISIFKAMLTPQPVTVDAMNIADFARELVQ